MIQRKLIIVTLQHLRSILPLAVRQFLVNWLPEFGVRSRQQLIPYKFEYSHYLSAEQCMDIIIGRRYMLIDSMRR